jgi:hypothetical protein
MIKIPSPGKVLKFGLAEKKSTHFLMNSQEFGRFIPVPTTL